MDASFVSSPFASASSTDKNKHMLLYECKLSNQLDLAGSMLHAVSLPEVFMDAYQYCVELTFVPLY